MSDKQDEERSESDSELEREIREGRKFTLEEADCADGRPWRDEGDVADHALATGSG